MLFDVQSALAEIMTEAALARDSCDSCDAVLPGSRMSQESQPSKPENKELRFVSRPTAESQESREPQLHSIERSNLTPHPKNAFELSRQTLDTFSYGTSAGGRPLTWTGRVVSPGTWHELSEWERHGPKGALWNGESRKWESRTTEQKP